MNRTKFILTILALYPIHVIGKIKNSLTPIIQSIRTSIGFVVKSGEARFGTHYKMKGVTLNNLDIKISAKDTDGDLAVFEQTGLTPNGGPPLHIHPDQDEWFYIIEGEYLFQVGEEKYQLKNGDTIFLPRNVQHAFIQLTQTSKAIVSYLPAGKMEDFFKSTDAWLSRPTKEDIIRSLQNMT